MLGGLIFSGIVDRFLRQIFCRVGFLASPFIPLTLLVGRQEGHLACKNWVLVC